jgi:hypothetical protein
MPFLIPARLQSYLLARTCSPRCELNRLDPILPILTNAPNPRTLHDNLALDWHAGGASLVWHRACLRGSSPKNPLNPDHRAVRTAPVVIDHAARSRLIFSVRRIGLIEARDALCSSCATEPVRYLTHRARRTFIAHLDWRLRRSDASL